VKSTSFVAATLLLIGSALGQTTISPVQQAAAVVPQLKEKMRDPDSFVLEHVYTASIPTIKCDSKWCRHKEHVKVDALCFIYRSRNGYGGYALSGGAVLPLMLIDAPLSVWKDKNLHFYERDERGEFHSTIGDEVVKACQRKFATGEITDDVKSVVASGPMAPADKAKAAQQYADCLKLAVDDFKITCAVP